MKKFQIIILSLLSVFILSSCTEEKVETVIKEKPVKTEIIKIESQESTLNYTGFLSPSIPLTETNMGMNNAQSQNQSRQYQAARARQLKTLVIKIFISSEDKNRIEVDDIAYFVQNGEKKESKVLKISDFPDPYTSTYEVDLEYPDEDNKDDEDEDEDLDKLNIGDFVNVNIVTGEKEGIWINIKNILSDGNDYVYVVKNNRAFIKNIKILSTYEDKVLVEGLEEGDELIISGYSSLANGYKVKVLDKVEKEE